MNKIFWYFVFCFLPFISFAQVGVNTSNPIGVFHVDGQKNNPPSRTLTEDQQSDDFVIIQNGNVGIGNTAPSAKLHITSKSAGQGFRLVDTSQDTGKYLVSDKDGNASWKNVSIRSVSGVFPSNAVTLPKSNSTRPTGAYITLPPGNWMIHLGSTVSTSSIIIEGSLWITFSIQDTNSGTTENPTPDYIEAYSGKRAAAGNISVGSFKNFISGAFAVKNNTTSNKTYYVWISQERTNQRNGGVDIYPSESTASGAFGIDAWERYLYAIPIE